MNDLALLLIVVLFIAVIFGGLWVSPYLMLLIILIVLLALAIRR